MNDLMVQDMLLETWYTRNFDQWKEMLKRLETK